MSDVPGRLPRRDAAAEVRGAARRTADAWRGAGLGPALVGVGVAVLFMVAFILFDYTFDQDPHRIIKVALGLLAVLAIMAQPKFGLLLLPVATPFLPWVPPAPVPGLNALNVLLFAIFGTFALGRVMAHQPLFRRGHLGLPIGLLILVCAVSIVRGAAFPTGYRYQGGISALILFRSATTFATYFIVYAMVNGPKERARVAWAVVVGLMAEAVVTLLYGRNGSSGRAIGSIGQANELGAFLAMYSIVAFAMMAGTKHWFGRILLLATFVAGATGIMYSVSRGAMLSFAVGLLYVAWRSSRWLFGILLIVLATSPLWAPDYLVERIKGTQKEVEGSDEVKLDRAAEARVQTWQTLIQIVKDHPLDGVGFAGLSEVLPDVGKELGLEEAVDSAHNTYLRMVAEMGIAGIGLFLYLMGRCLWLAEQGLRCAKTRLDRGIAIGLSGATISMLVTCAFGDRFFNVVIASSYWVLCALAEDMIAERRRSVA